MIKPKALIFTDWYYPGYKAGGPIQSCRNLVKMLAPEMDFYVLSSDTDLNEHVSYPNIKAEEWTAGPAGERVYYVRNGKLSALAIRRIVKKLQPDIIYFNSMFSLRFTILPLVTLKLMRFSGKIVLAPRGMLHEGALFFKPGKKKLFLRLFRFLKWHKQIHFHATDIQEKNDIEAYFPESNISIAENIPAINIAYTEHSDKQASILRLIFFSRLHPKKNPEYILHLLNKNEFKGEVHFDIFGDAASQPYLDSCKQLTNNLPSNIKIRFMGGATQEEILNLLPGYDAFVLPTLGENFGHVIFESLMSGVPVLISDQTPWRNLSATQSGWDIPLDQPEMFAERIRELLSMDSATHQQWRRGARNLAETYLQNADFTRKYLQLFQ